MKAGETRRPLPTAITQERPVPAGGRRSVRIIGGQWKRRLLPVLDAEGLRPTADRVRETLFNWLGQDLTGRRCLDLFAGSGALGFEAASRGASQVVLLEQNARIFRQLRENALRLQADKVDVVHMDALRYVAHGPVAAFDVIFIDPPFAQNLWLPALVGSLPLLRADGVIYIESASLLTADLGLPAHVEIWRQGRAGRVFYHLVTPKAG